MCVQYGTGFLLRWKSYSCRKEVVLELGQEKEQLARASIAQASPWTLFANGGSVQENDQDLEDDAESDSSFTPAANWPDVYRAGRD